MKKMKTMFKREFIKEGKRTVKIITHNEIEEGCEWVLNEPVEAYRKIDGTCCLIKDGEIYKRFDYKKGRKLPDGAIPCEDKADETTGHFPHWVKCRIDNPDDKYHLMAFDSLWRFGNSKDGTYELIGEHFNKNKDKLVYNADALIKHDSETLFLGQFNVEGKEKITFEKIKNYLEEVKIEGIVFYRQNGDMCKIKRSDFGFEW